MPDFEQQGPYEAHERVDQELYQESRAKVDALINKVAFQDELQRLINRHSQENNSGTPDFILAQYIQNSLNAFNLAVNEREKWYGREQDRFGMPASWSPTASVVDTAMHGTAMDINHPIMKETANDQDIPAQTHSNPSSPVDWSKS